MTSKWVWECASVCVTINFHVHYSCECKGKRGKKHYRVICQEHLPQLLSVIGKEASAAPVRRWIALMESRWQPRWLFKGPFGCNLRDFSRDLCLPYSRGSSLQSYGKREWIIVSGSRPPSLPQREREALSWAVWLGLCISLALYSSSPASVKPINSVISGAQFKSCWGQRCFPCWAKQSTVPSIPMLTTTQNCRKPQLFVI